MKFLPAQLMYFFQTREARKKIRTLCKFLLLLALLVTLYSIIFHYLMAYEGRTYSWVTGFYWALTVMSTLGFGDITFTSDVGRIFSMFVLLSGIVFLLIILPFTFIQFFYAPWLEAQSRARAPRELPPEVSQHVILTSFDPITITLVDRLRDYGYKYVLVTPDLHMALDLHDQGYSVAVGELDDPGTYLRLRVERAALVVATNDDMKNTNIAFTIREIAPEVPVVTNADQDDSIDILQLAGSTHVFQFMKMLGQVLARRALGLRTQSNIVGRFDGLCIAEAPAMRTPLVGQTLLESRLREITGINVVGLWERGHFEIPRPDTRINATTVLVLAGSEEQLGNFDLLFVKPGVIGAPVIILGGGRVGCAAAEALREREIPYRIVENNPRLIKEEETYIQGNAADLNILVRAGINAASSVFITTHNDDLNIYLTIYCRRLRPDIQIISRATLDRNISVLHAAGADLVMSHASLAANTIINLLAPNKVLMLSEGLNIFRMQAPSSLHGQSLRQSRIREKTGCSVIALRSQEGLNINPDPRRPISGRDELILIGTVEAEKAFIKQYAANL